MTQTQQEKLLKIVELIVKKYSSTQAIYLFGSWGTKYQTAKSDIDLAVLFPYKEAKELDVVEFQYYFPTKVTDIAGSSCAHLINLRNVDLTFQYEVISSGDAIYSGVDDDADTRLKFEFTVASRYSAFHKTRELAIEEHIKRDKLRYG